MSLMCFSISLNEGLGIPSLELCSFSGFGALGCSFWDVAVGRQFVQIITETHVIVIFIFHVFLP